MAVSKTQKLGIRMGGCRQDRAYKDYTSNPISTSSFSMLCFCRLHYEVAGKSFDIGMGLLV